MSSFTVGTVFQQAFVVEDLDRALPAFSRDLNIGGWLRLKNAQAWPITYHGEAGLLPLSVALGYAGPIMVELIQQHGDQPSIYRDGVARGGYGFHHWGLVVDDYDARLAHYGAAPGYAEVASLGGGNGRAVYVDAVPALPGMLELIEYTPRFRSYADMIYDLRRDWSPEGPVVRQL